MPIPTFTTMTPFANIDDIRNHVNRLTKELQNIMLNLDSLNVVHLTAETIDTGTLDANKVTIRADLQAGAYVSIDGDGLTINNGTEDTFQTDLNGNVTARSMRLINDLTGTGSVNISNTGITISDGTRDTFVVNANGDVSMTSATIQSDTGYPRVEMDPAGDLFGAYRDANNFIEIEADYLGSPVINVVENGAVRGQISSSGQKLLLSGVSGVDLVSNGDVQVTPGVGNYLRVGTFGRIFGTTEGTDLLTLLGTKVNTTFAFSTYGVNLAFDPGTRNLKMFAGNGSTIAQVNIP